MTGIIGTSFDSAMLVQSVLSGHRALTLALYHKNGGTPLQLIGRAGADPRGRSPGYADRIALGGGWFVEATGMSDRSVSPNGRVSSLSVSACSSRYSSFWSIVVLSRSRRRAWGLVGEKTDELEYRALHDPLTDLPNRSLVLDRAEQILARARRLDVPVTALFVDIDGFKQINDRYGHRAGDEVLRQVGARLKSAPAGQRHGRSPRRRRVRDAGRFASGWTPRRSWSRSGSWMCFASRSSCLDPAHPPISLTASIGIATGRPASAEDLMQDADLALYKAKAIGKNGYVKFESAMQTAAQDRIHLEMDLATHSTRDQFFLVYQPMLDLESEQVVGVEALLRWRHPTSGVIAPDVSSRSPRKTA